MSIPLILTAKNYISASSAYYGSDVDTENGIFSYGSNYYKTFIESAEKGYKLPKSTKKDGSFDGIWGDETKQALLDYQTKNKKK